MLALQQKPKKVMLEAVSLSVFKFSTSKRRSRESIIKEMTEAIEHRIYEDCLSDDSTFVRFMCPSGEIEVSVKNDDTCEVAVSHYLNEHESPNLESYIARVVPNWGEVQAKAEDELKEEEECNDYLQRCCKYM